MNLHKAGYTVLEVMIATAILTVVMMVCFGIISTSQKLETHSIKTGQLHERARFIAERIARELRYSSADSPNFEVSDSAGVTWVSFRKCLGYDAALQQPNWGRLITYELRVDTNSGETDITDGIDNNNNGIIDEGALFRREEGMQERRLARDVLASSFQIQRWGKTVELSIALAQPDPTARDRIIRGTYVTSVVLRN